MLHKIMYYVASYWLAIGAVTLATGRMAQLVKLCMCMHHNNVVTYVTIFMA